MRRLTILWFLSMPLLPVLWLQGLYARWRTPRLPEALGPTSGIAGLGQRPLRLAVLGESPVAGVGVEHYENSLSAQIAYHLARLTGCQVHWSAIGENGANIEDTRNRLVMRLDGFRPDVVVVALGVNDSTQLTSRARWRAAVQALVQAIRTHTDCLIIFAPVPPLSSFTALPQPLREVLGIRGRLLNGEITRAIENLPDVQYAGELPPLPQHYLSRDGYHPSEEGCRAWGETLGRCIAAAMAERTK